MKNEKLCKSIYMEAVLFAKIFVLLVILKVCTYVSTNVAFIDCIFFNVGKNWK